MGYKSKLYYTTSSKGRKIMIEVCPICNKNFSCRGSLNRHLVNIHNEKPILKSNEDTTIYNFIFYMHICIVNNKRYIGATAQKSIKSR